MNQIWFKPTPFIHKKLLSNMSSRFPKALLHHWIHVTISCVLSSFEERCAELCANSTCSWKAFRIPFSILIRRAAIFWRGVLYKRRRGVQGNAFYGGKTVMYARNHASPPTSTRGMFQSGHCERCGQGPRQPKFACQQGIRLLHGKVALADVLRLRKVAHRGQIGVRILTVTCTYT